LIAAGDVDEVALGRRTGHVRRLRLLKDRREGWARMLELVSRIIDWFSECLNYGSEINIHCGTWEACSLISCFRGSLVWSPHSKWIKSS
jgi:hypothetical protein